MLEDPIAKMKESPLIVQVLVRGLQSIVSKMMDGADVKLYRDDEYIILETKMSKLTVRRGDKMVQVIWEKKLEDENMVKKFKKIAIQHFESSDDEVEFMGRIAELVDFCFESHHLCYLERLVKDVTSRLQVS